MKKPQLQSAHLVTPLFLTPAELPTQVSGTDGGTERKEVGLRPMAAARGGITPRDQQCSLIIKCPDATPK